MKSVVVEASTVAKAIETAWLKADKPEEFFIRVLQEHQSGFLGFGSQKAKVVFFFKNSQKSDSLFPVVLKQKEYTNLFDNHHLKIPAELNFIDTESNKNVALGGGYKKKSVYQNQQQKNKQNVQNKISSELSTQGFDKQNKLDLPQQNQQKLANKVVHGKQKDRGVTQVKIQNKPAIAQEQKMVTSQKNKVTTDDLHAKKNHSNVSYKKNVENLLIADHTNIVEPKKALQVTLQAPIQETDNIKLLDFFDKKEDVVKDIARALKKVQSQKIVAHVSRQASEKIQELQTISIDNKPDKLVSSRVDKERVEPEKVAELVTKKVETKFKRRPLIVDENVVSGIKPRTVSPALVDEKKASSSINKDDKKDLS